MLEYDLTSNRTPTLRVVSCVYYDVYIANDPSIQFGQAYIPASVSVSMQPCLSRLLAMTVTDAYSYIQYSNYGLSHTVRHDLPNILITINPLPDMPPI